MSKSFDVSFAQSFKVTLTEEQLQSIRKELTDFTEAVESRPDLFTATQKARVAVIRGWLQKPDDEFYPFFLKTAMRTNLRQEIVNTISGDPDLNATKFGPATVTVTPRIPTPKPQVACVVPDPACDCSFCRGF